MELHRVNSIIYYHSYQFLHISSTNQTELIYFDGYFVSARSLENESSGEFRNIPLVVYIIAGTYNMPTSYQ